MAALKQSLGADERLSDDDLSALRLRVGNSASQPREPGTTIRDIAEATGLTVDEVRAHLDQLRAERAFTSPSRAPQPWLLYAGLAALVLAAGVTYVRSRQSAVPMGPYMQASPLVVTSHTVQMTSRPLPPMVSLPQTYVQNTAAAPTPGMHIDIVGEGSELVGDGGYRWEPMPQATVRSRMTQSLIELSYQVDRRQGLPAPIGTVRDSQGNPVRFRKGYYHYAITGWLGSASGYIPSPITDPTGTEREAKRVVDNLMQNTSAADAEALRTDLPAGGPSTITPPPGFAVSYAGRRLTDLPAPKMSYPPYDLARVRRRLALCMKDLIVRDLRPPQGHWELPATQESHIPIPSMGHFTVKSPDGEVDFDVPLAKMGANPSSAADKVISAWAAKAANSMEVVNAQARENARE